MTFIPISTARRAALAKSVMTWSISDTESSLGGFIVKSQGAGRYYLPASFIDAEEAAPGPRIGMGGLSAGVGKLDGRYGAAAADGLHHRQIGVRLAVGPQPQIPRADPPLRLYSGGFHHDQTGASDRPGPAMHCMPYARASIHRLGRVLAHGRDEYSVGNVLAPDCDGAEE